MLDSEKPGKVRNPGMSLGSLPYHHTTRTFVVPFHCLRGSDFGPLIAIVISMDEACGIDPILRDICAVVPFKHVKGSDLDLLMAATVEPGKPAQIIQTDAGFDASYFSQLGKGSVCEKDCDELLKSARTFEYADFTGYYEKKKYGLCWCQC